jgi:hypothetical protein
MPSLSNVARLAAGRPTSFAAALEHLARLAATAAAPGPRDGWPHHVVEEPPCRN